MASCKVARQDKHAQLGRKVIAQRGERLTLIGAESEQMGDPGRKCIQAKCRLDKVTGRVRPGVSAIKLSRRSWSVRRQGERS